MVVPAGLAQPRTQLPGHMPRPVSWCPKWLCYWPTRDHTQRVASESGTAFLRDPQALANTGRRLPPRVKELIVATREREGWHPGMRMVSEIRPSPPPPHLGSRGASPGAAWRAMTR